jgi:hypothetical protein
MCVNVLRLLRTRAEIKVSNAMWIKNIWWKYKKKPMLSLLLSWTNSVHLLSHELLLYVVFFLYFHQMFFIHIALGTVITALVLNNLSTFTLIWVAIIYWFFFYKKKTIYNSNSYECKCTQVVEDKNSDNSA